MANFGDLINIDGFEKRDDFKQERGNISFFCKDCNKITETNRENPKGYVFICTQCQGTNIAIGTLEGLKIRFKIKS